MLPCFLKLKTRFSQVGNVLPETTPTPHPKKKKKKNLTKKVDYKTWWKQTNNRVQQSAPIPALQLGTFEVSLSAAPTAEWSQSAQMSIHPLNKT